jgi:hypothetical protein
MPALPDAELVGLTILEHLAPTVTVLPPGFDPPIIAVQRVGGPLDLDTYTDRATLQFTFYGVNRPKAWDLAAAGQRALLDAAGTEVAGVLIEYVDIPGGGVQTPDLDPDDRRVIATVEIGLDLRAYFAPA